MLRFWNWLQRLWNGTLSFIRDNVRPALRVVEFLKACVDSEVAELIVVQTETTLDDRAREILSHYLRKAATVLGIVATCSEHDTPNEQLLCYVRAIKALPEEQRKGIYARLASRMARIARAGDGRSPLKLSEPEIDAIVQMEYAHSRRTGELSKHLNIPLA